MFGVGRVVKLRIESLACNRDFCGYRHCARINGDHDNRLSVIGVTFISLATERETP